MKWLAASALLLAAHAHAQRAASSLADDAERPWALGVSTEQQSRARALFEQGNAFFTESQHALALARYREAVAAWNHPGIRYNMAVSLIHLDQPLAAYEDLQEALRYGAAPLGPELYDQALTYKKLLEGQLAELRVVCAEPGAEVALDGEPLFRSPGERKRRLAPGAHQLVASKPGHVTESRALLLLPGKPTVETLRLRPLPWFEARRRWSWWKPWLVLASGVAVAAAGVPLLVQARDDYARYDAWVTAMCRGGCPIADVPPSVSEPRSRAPVENGVAIASFTVGGALVASGVALLILNQPRVVERRIALLPTISPRAAGALLRVAF
jgi:hypothetical protein